MTALLVELGEDLWDSDLAITQLDVGFSTGAPGLGDALGTRTSFVCSTELEAAFGPKPPRPDPLPPFTDPGNPDC